MSGTKLPTWAATDHHHPGPGEAGVARCPVCSRHDHRDARPFGYTLLRVRGEKPNPTSGDHLERTFRLAVPAWAFTCEACPRPGGSLMGVASTIDVWTPDGARWRREHPELFDGQQPMLMDDEHLPGGF